MKMACLRMILMIVFFAYIAFDWLPRSDIFIILVVAVFSVASGYLAVLSYEYAAASLQTKVCILLLSSASPLLSLVLHEINPFFRFSSYS